MKKLLCVVCANLLLWACQSDENRLTETSTKEALSEFTIPKEQAIEDLSGFLKALDENEQNSPSKAMRSKRKILSVQSVNYDICLQKPNAKSQGDSISPDAPLLYIVNFENNAGYAVLAADKRIGSPILAIVDEGNTDPDAFYNSYTYYDPTNDIPGFKFYNSELDDYYVAASNVDFGNQLIIDYANNSINRPFVDTFGLMNPELATYSVEGPWVDFQRVGPLLSSQWDQDSPYNDQCPLTSNKKKHCPTGCVATALAQIVTYHNFPITWQGITFDWNSIHNVGNVNKPDRISSSHEKQAVAQLNRFIGFNCKAWYTDKWTFAFPSNAAKTLRDMGYSDVELHRGKYSLDITKNMLFNKKPVFIAAVSGVFNGHAWVIDGYLKQSKTTTIYRKNNPSEYWYVTSTRELVHCNWGWGSHGGYYYSGIFDLDREVLLSKSKNYDWLFRTITYNL